METTPYSPGSTPPAPARPTATPATTWLLIAGSSLIVIGLIVLILFSWDSFGPLGRVVVAALPIIALYLIGFLTRSNSAQEKLSLYTILTASIGFPLALGVIIYQSGLCNPGSIDALLVFIISLVSLLWYMAMEFLLRQYNHAPLTILAALSSAISFVDVAQAPYYVYSLLGIILAYFFLSAGWYFEESRRQWQSAFYTYTGLAVGWYGLVSFPLAYFDRWFDTSIGLAYLPVSVIFFLVAILYSRRWQATHSSQALAIRQTCEQSAAITLTVPAILAGLSEGLTANALLMILTGILSILISLSVKVKTFQYLGIAGLALGLFELLFFAAQKVPGFWPILLLLAGFLLIGIAYGAHHGTYRKWMEKWHLGSDDSLFGLGDLPVPSPDTSMWSHETHQIGVFWYIIAIVIGLHILAIFISR